MVMAISVLWIAVRAFFALRNKKLIVKRELQLILVYICLIVVARFTFCPLRKVDGVIQPLLFDPANILPFRINLIPFVNLFDYDIFSEAIINFIGNRGNNSFKKIILRLLITLTNIVRRIAKALFAKMNK